MSGYARGKAPERSAAEPLILGIRFSDWSIGDLTEKIVSEAVPVGVGPRIVVTANLDHIVRLRTDASLKRAYERAWIATADGMPVYLYARWRGAALPSRVTGSDLFAAVMHKLDPARHRCFFVASTPATVEKLAAYLHERGFAGGAIRAAVPPFGFEHDDTYSVSLAEEIAQHRATHVFFGVGAPKSEVWTDRHRAALGPCYVLNVGSGLNFFVGETARAPLLMRRAGFEWLWRFSREPRRLFPRYFIYSWLFLDAVRLDLMQKKKLVSRASGERSRP